MEIIFSNNAIRKLDQLLSEIGERFGDNIKIRVKNEILSTIKHASYFKELGKTYRDDIRFLIVKKRTIIFYRHEKEKMYVISIFLTNENWLNKF